MVKSWTESFVEFFKANEGREPTKKEIYLATPLKLVAETNPKKKGTMSYDRFQGYFNGPETIGEAFEEGLRQDDIRHDADKGFIIIGAAALAEEGTSEEPVEDGEHHEVLMIEDHSKEA